MLRKFVFIMITLLICSSCTGEDQKVQVHLKNDYDVIVIGGDPEGVAASVSAARNGGKTLLVEERDGLGGLLTYGYLNQLDLGYDKYKRLANQGIFAKWYKKIGERANFDIELGKKAFHELVEQEPNITLLLESSVKEIHKEQNKVVAVTLETPQGEKKYFGKRFIDTTSEADFAVRAGVPYTLGQEDMGLKDRLMAVTLVMLFENVDWERLKQAAKQGVLGGAKVGDQIAWGFAEVPSKYKTSQENTRVRGLNIGIQSNGVVTINALQIFGVDGTDPQSIKQAIETGKEETKHFLTFLKKELPGFEEARIAGYPTELYIRETRHIKAEYQLSIVDIWENRDQWDSIGFGAYPVDVQATEVSSFGTVITAPTQYAIPFRSLVPLEVENLLVASKSSGYTSLAAGSARTVPIGMTVAEAAGVAAVLSLEQEMSFRQLAQNQKAIKELQKRLKKQGANIYPFNITFPYQGAWFYPAIRELLPFGLIAGGYSNQLNENEKMKEREFLRLLAGLMIRKDEKMHAALSKSFNPWDQSVAAETEKVWLTRDKAMEYLLQLFGFPLHDSSWEEAKKHQFVDSVLEKRVSINRKLTRAEIYYLLAHVVKMIDQGRFAHAYELGNDEVGYIDVFNGRAMIPTRFLKATLGAKVNWNKETNQLTVEHKGEKLILQFNSNQAEINGESVQLDSISLSKQGVSYVPLKTVAELFGLEVHYIKGDQIVEIEHEGKRYEIKLYLK